jgi:hypothetical protein
MRTERFGTQTLARSRSEGNAMSHVVSQAWQMNKGERSAITDLPALKAAYSIYRKGVTGGQLVAAIALLRGLKNGQTVTIAIHGLGYQATATIVNDPAGHMMEPHDCLCTLVSATGGIED